MFRNMVRQYFKSPTTKNCGSRLQERMHEEAAHSSRSTSQIVTSEAPVSRTRLLCDHDDQILTSLTPGFPASDKTEIAMQY